MSEILCKVHLGVVLLLLLVQTTVHTCLYFESLSDSFSWINSNEYITVLRLGDFPLLTYFHVQKKMHKTKLRAKLGELKWDLFNTNIDIVPFTYIPVNNCYLVYTQGSFLNVQHVQIVINNVHIH